MNILWYHRELIPKIGIEYWKDRWPYDLLLHYAVLILFGADRSIWIIFLKELLQIMKLIDVDCMQLQ